MRIDEAYRALGLEPALEFEARRLEELHHRLPPSMRQPDIVDFPNPTIRRIGTTTRMLVMAALDLADGQSVEVRVPTQPNLIETRSTLHGWVRTLGGTDRDIRGLDVVLIGRTGQPGRHTRVYVDHTRDLVTGDDRRILGPFGWAYRVGSSTLWDHSFRVFDRDGELLAEVTRAGLNDLEQNHCVALIRG